MKRLLFAFCVFCHSIILSNVTVYFSYGVFNTASSKPYLETYLTISGSSVKFLPVKGGYQANVNISWKILKGTQVVKTSSYNVMSPIATDTLHLPSFIDSQRFSLENGQYTLELVIADKTNPDKKSTHSEKINIQFKREKKVNTSDIQILESYSKSSEASVISKNGYDLIPYTINYFPKNHNTVKFYFEAYNLDTLIGANTKFVYAYHIENTDNTTKPEGLSGFQRQSAARVNPLLAQFDISRLPTGNYNLVVDVKDSTNAILATKKWFFQRLSDVVAAEVPEDGSIKNIEDFFNNFQNQDSLKQFIECLWPISFTQEREWQQTQIAKKDPGIMRSYLVGYWKKQAADTIDPLKMWLEYYKEVLKVNALLKCGKQKGYYTDRGRVYLQYGKPNQRGQYTNDPGTYPYEIWQYYRIYDRSTKRFFSNKRFVFANFGIADDCYELIHSEVRGEAYDERWKFRLVNRTQQSNNLDNTSPGKTYGNNIDENFNNPR